ncbi:putative methyltransferase [Drosera capensis]
MIFVRKSTFLCKVRSMGKSFSLSSPVLVLFLLLSTNLLTYYLSTSSNYRFFSFDRKPSDLEEKSLITRPGLKDTEDDLPPEFVAYAYGEKLPFGFNARFDSDTMFSSVGRACSFYKEDLRHYMSYQVNDSCPDDEPLAQKLLLKGCEPLPRRRCHPAASSDYEEPVPFPNCLWTTPPDSSVVWTAHTCKSCQCLIDRRNHSGSDDCKDCFHLQGREKTRWIPWPRRNALEFTIDEVLELKHGTIRIGLDIGGGAGTFAVRMLERNVTIVTTSMNFNAPFNNFIASRGVVPLFISVSQRLPFFDNTLDIVHSMHVLSNWIPKTLFHFMLFDIYRVLRPGGLFWLDHFFCKVDQWEETYKPLIESVGFQKQKWEMGNKLDKPGHQEMYLSALLEKPLKNSW